MPAILLTISVSAQNYNDVINFNKCDYVGTARSQAMGSAFGALGADLTSQSINPAGLAAYRATEIGMSIGVDVDKSTSNYNGYKSDDDKISVPFSNIGASFIFGNTMRENTQGILSQNFSISYSRLADYNRNATYSDLYSRNSLLDYFCIDDKENNNDILNDEFSGKIANDAGWITGPFTDESTNTNITFSTNVWEDPYGDNILNLDARVDADGLGLIDHIQHVKEKGYKGETSFAYAMNISNKIYWGASMGIVSMRYKEKVTHYEDYYGTPFDNTNSNFTYTTDLDNQGSGINFKAGMIVKPVNALRIGLAVHSPSFMKINERYETSIDGAYDNYIYRSPSGDYDYNYRTPGKFVGSLAGIIGSYAIVSVDYEMSDYGKSKFKDEDGGSSTYYDNINKQIENTLKRTQTLRAGIEGRVIECLYLRAGYNMQTTPYKNGILQNSYKHQAISGGIGFRHNNFFLDAAYVCRTDKGDRWVLPDVAYLYGEDNTAASIESKSHNVIVSVGFRF